MSSLKVVDSSTFEAEVIESKDPVLVEFGATWCGPCKAMAPILEQFAKSHSEIKVCTVDVDDSPELAKAFKIMGVPTLVYIKDGKVASSRVGLTNPVGLTELIK